MVRPLTIACGLLLVTTMELHGAPIFVRGDADGNGSLTITDAVRTLFFLFQGGAVELHPRVRCDRNRQPSGPCHLEHHLHHRSCSR